MSEVELDPIQARPSRGPEPGPPSAAPAARTSGALFDTGMGAGMGAPTLLRHLSRRPPDDRKAGIEDLNDRVGNRRVSRMIATHTLARHGYDDGYVPDYSPSIDTSTASEPEKLK